MCKEGTAPISQFAALLERGARVNIHDKVDCSTPINSIIMVCSIKVAMVVYPMLYLCRRAAIHSGVLAAMEGQTSLTFFFSTVLKWT